MKVKTDVKAGPSYTPQQLACMAECAKLTGLAAAQHAWLLCLTERCGVVMGD